MNRPILLTCLTLLLATSLSFAEIGYFGYETEVYDSDQNMSVIDLADFDGDGYRDLVRGSFGHSNLQVLQRYSFSSVGFHLEGNLYYSESTISVVRTPDMNDDGLPDVVAAASGDGSIVWWRNLGDDFEFSTMIEITENQGVRDLDFADFDGDGLLDIVAAANDSESLFLMLQNSPTDFTRQAVAVQDTVMRDVTVGDLDGDGDIDIVSAIPNALVIWENDGAASFTRHNLDPFGGIRAIDIADLDGDGDLDLLAGSHVLGTIRTWENTGGEFVERTFQADCESLISMRSADLDYDGDIDILYAMHDTQTIMVAENIGPWQFRLVEVTGTFNEPLQVIPIEADNDTDVDIAAITRNPSKMSYWLLHRPSDWDEEVVMDEFGVAWSLTGTDMDDDGDVDPVVSGADPGRVSILENDGSGEFTEHQIYGYQHFSLQVADFNVDGQPDVAGIYTTGGYRVRVFLNEGDFEFSQELLPGVVESMRMIAVADMNGDGFPDIVCEDHEVMILYTYFGDGTGQFDREQVHDFADGGYKYVIVPCDIDGDGDNDLFISLDDYQPGWLENPGNGLSYTPHVIDGLGSSYFEDGKACDWDQDGDQDLIIAYDDQARLEILENDGAGNFTVHTYEDTHSFASDIWLTDVDVDGDLDICASGYSISSVYWYENTNPAEFELAEHFVTDRYRLPNDIFAAPLDGDAAPDIMNLNGGIESEVLALYHSPLDIAPHPQIQLVPFNPPIVLPPIGGDVVYDARLTNPTTELFTGQAWSELLLPNGQLQPLRTVDVELDPGGQLEQQYLVEHIPGYAPAGLYTFTAYVGQYPGVVDDESSFSFTKLAALVPAGSGGAAASALPDHLAMTCSPNPFNAMSTLKLALPQAGEVRVIVYDLLGRQVSVLADGITRAGYHHYTLDASALASGMYFVTVDAKGSGQITRKVMVMK